jgi:hypothetical protein
MIDAMRLLGDPLAAADTSDLADEVVLETIDGRLYGEAVRSGLSFIVGGDGRVRTVHLHAEGHEGYVGFAGELPEGIRFDMSRAEVRSILGSPGASGEPRAVDFYGEAPAWDRFVLETAQVHVEYGPDQNSIQLVTLMLRDVVPGSME